MNPNGVANLAWQKKQFFHFQKMQLQTSTFRVVASKDWNSWSAAFHFENTLRKRFICVQISQTRREWSVMI